MSAENHNQLETLATELAIAQRKIDSLEREKRRVGLSFHRIPEAGYQISRLWAGDFPYLQKIPSLSCEKPPEDSTFQADANTVLIEADNLAALMTLQLTHKGKIDVIYIDPPYNRGKDFVYNDARISSMKDVQGAQASDYEVTLDGKARMVGKDDPERHSKWLSFMERRLWLAKDLLSPTGVIFLSIDDTQQARLKMLMDSVFGESNFVAQLIWKKKSGGGMDSKHIIIDHEYIICFAKSISGAVINKDPFGIATTSYNQIDDVGQYALERLDKQNLRYSDSLNYEILDQTGNSYKPKHKNPQKPNATWRWSKETVEERYEQLVFKDGNVYTKNYESLEGQIPSTLLLDKRFGRTRTGSQEVEKILGATDFDYPKPVGLISHLLRISADKNALILDFFAGTGTTAHAVAELNKEDGGNRECILVTHGDENGKNIATDITAERIKRALSGENWADGKKRGPLPGSLYYYKLLFVPQSKNPITTMETMQSRFTGIASLEQDAHVEVAQESNYAIFRNSKKLVLVWKNSDDLDDDPDSAFIPLLNTLKSQYPELEHIVYTPSTNESSFDEYGVTEYGWTNYSYPIEYLTDHASLLERMKRNKTMLQPFEDNFSQGDIDSGIDTGTSLSSSVFNKDNASAEEVLGTEIIGKSAVEDYDDGYTTEGNGVSRG